MPFPTSPWQPSNIEMVRRGDTYYFHAAPWIVNQIDPYDGLVQGDLTQDGLGNAHQRLAMSDWNGFRMVPEEALSFRVKCHLFRGVANSNGHVDVTWHIKMNPNEGDYNSLDTLATLAFSHPLGSSIFPAGSYPEIFGGPIDIPNIVEGNDWGVFYHQFRGQTPLGAAGMMRLLSFTVPANYTLPTVWPYQTVTTELSLDFTSFDDSSLNDLTVTSHGVTLDGNGNAVFSNAWLSIGNSSPITLAGDFTIKGEIQTSTKSLDANCQRRVLSFGGPSDNSPGIYIDPTSGALVLVQEFVGAVKTGSVNVATGSLVSFQWNRAGAVNTLYINGVADGATFSDSRTWNIMPGAEIGRLKGNAVGRYLGSMRSLEIVNGEALSP